MRKIFIKIASVVAFAIISITVQAQTKVVVIPMFSDATISQEVCNGTPVGSLLFTLSDPGGEISTGDVYSTTTGHLVEITGHTGNLFVRTQDGIYNFRIAPDSLPQPSTGVKGPYYVLAVGEIAYARFL